MLRAALRLRKRLANGAQAPDPGSSSDRNGAPSPDHVCLDLVYMLAHVQQLFLSVNYRSRCDPRIPCRP